MTHIEDRKAIIAQTLLDAYDVLMICNTLRKRRRIIAHIPDGVVSAPVLVTGALVTVALVGVAVRRLDPDRLPQTALLSAVFFVASLFSVPLGPGSVHLTLNGLMGLVLGWAAAPAFLIALLLQAVFFGFGGLVVLGVNTMNLAVPALVCAALFGPFLHHARSPRQWAFLGAGAGVLGVVLSGIMICTTLALSGREFLAAAKIVIATFIPLMLIEGAVTGAAIGFLKRVAPEIISPQGAPNA